MAAGWRVADCGQVRASPTRGLVATLCSPSRGALRWGLEALDKLFEEVDLVVEGAAPVLGDSYPGAGSTTLVSFLDAYVACCL